MAAVAGTADDSADLVELPPIVTALRAPGRDEVVVRLRGAGDRAGRPGDLVRRARPAGRRGLAAIVRHARRPRRGTGGRDATERTRSGRGRNGTAARQPRPAGGLGAGLHPGAVRRSARGPGPHRPPARGAAGRAAATSGRPPRPARCSTPPSSWRSSASARRTTSRAGST